MLTSTASKAEYGIVVAKDVMIPMRDGVRLASDIYFPAIDGQLVASRWPAILGRTSYDKTNETMWVKPVCEYFSSRGYVVVCQDLRGRYKSEGFGQYFHTANVNEGRDGYDTIEWIAAQSWSDGKVATTGSSHGAIVQHVAALHQPPHLVAIWPDVGPTSNYAHESREGGAMSLQMFGALFMHAFDAQEVHAQPGARAVIVDAMEHMREWVQRSPFKPGHTPLSVVPALEKTLFDYYWRGAYDEFWSHECNDQERYWNERHPDLPGTYSGGWWDPFSGGTTRYDTAMAKRHNATQRLPRGPGPTAGRRPLRDRTKPASPCSTRRRASARRSGRLRRAPPGHRRRAATVRHQLPHVQSRCREQVKSDSLGPPTPAGIPYRTSGMRRQERTFVEADHRVENSRHTRRCDAVRCELTLICGCCLLTHHPSSRSRASPIPK